MKISKLPTLTEIAAQANAKAESYKNAKHPTKIPPSTVQAASTQRTLDRDPSEDAKHFARTTSISGQTTSATDIGDLDNLVPKATLDPSQVEVIEGMRREGHGNTFDNAEESSVNEAKKKAALNAIKGI